MLAVDQVEDPAGEVGQADAHPGGAVVRDEQVPGIGDELELPWGAAAGGGAEGALGEQAGGKEFVDALGDQFAAEPGVALYLRAGGGPSTADQVKDHGERGDAQIEQGGDVGQVAGHLDILPCSDPEFSEH
ncbi:hypothetical protein GCM10009828_051720 [Actinoplanes couchii]